MPWGSSAVPVLTRRRADRRTRALRAGGVMVSLVCAALLGVVCWVGVQLAGTVSVAAAWDRFIARVEADPRYQLLDSALQQGGSADCTKQLLFALVDAAAGDGTVVLLSPDDILATAAAFRAARVQEVQVQQGGLVIRFSVPDGPDAARAIADELAALGIYQGVELDTAGQGDYTLRCRQH